MNRSQSRAHSRAFLATLALILTLTPALPAAAAVGSIESLQSPAWLDRGGLSVPAAPGLTLEAGDTLRTGVGSRMVLKLEEGSFVKLGENARFVIERAQPKPGGAYQALLNVVEGAFRFTTQLASRGQPRDVTLKLAQNATIGVRGTDLWGRGTADRDIVVLIEGRIEITGNDGRSLTLDQPRQFFQSGKKTAPEPLTILPQEELVKLAAETEMEFGKGASLEGEWKVVIGGFASRDEARAAARLLRTNGFPVEIDDRTLTVGRLVNELAANRMAAQWKSGSGYKDIRVGREVPAR